MKGYEAVNAVLRTEGVDDIFALMSEDNMKLVSALDAGDDVNVVDVRHEQCAVTMAYAYAKTADTIGVCTVGRGPAVAQTGNALVTARKLGAKMVVIVPTPAVSPSYAHRDLDSKDFEQDAFLDSTIGRTVDIESPEHVVERTIEGFRQVRNGDGPVAIQIPRDILEEELGPSDTDKQLLREGKRSFQADSPRVQPNPDRIDAAVELLLDSDISKPPVIVGGLGLRGESTREAVLELAERLNALLVTTLQAQGVFGDHPYYLGFCGDYGHDLANQYVIESDYILGFGCSLNPHTTDSGYLFEDGDAIVHVDADPAAIEAYTDVDVGIVGDAEQTAEAFLEAVKRLDIDLRGEYWTSSMRREIENASPFNENRSTPQNVLDPRDLALALDEALPADRTVVMDGGHFARWVLDGIRVPSPDRFVWTVDFASIGQGVPGGIGAAVGDDSAATIAFCGDAGCMMSLQEIETAARHDIPVTYVVFNDDALGAELHNMQVSAYDGAESAVVEAPEFAAVAEALGATGKTVRSVEEVAALEDAIPPRNGPLVVDCKVDPSVRHPNQFE
ncbi:MAG: thiamine pyrophosphate-binding protein [Salinirussus sp.]